MSEKDVTAVDVSVVIVNHNHRPVIEKCFESLYSLPDHTSFETILIDNTCADGVSEWVAENYPHAEIRRNTVRRGFAANANTGMRTLRRGRYALLLNPDVICLPGLLDRMVEFMDNEPRAAIAASAHLPQVVGCVLSMRNAVVGVPPGTTKVTVSEASAFVSFLTMNVLEPVS